VTEDALNRAYKAARIGIGSGKDTMETLKCVLQKTALRIIDAEYVDAQMEARKHHADSD